ncbi:MAG: RNHCP domain-containing protein [Defluviitaleaceae bacterium]|nr:RNHCP domain-containing protein [Defluviitaleaceae bacterium]
MGRKTENSSFICVNCGLDVQAIKKGTIRNHCPFCLFSLHLDISPGDRQSDCHGVLRPIDIVSHSKKGWQIIHKCDSCGFEGKNKLADDDDIEKISILMKKRALHNIES